MYEKEKNIAGIVGWEKKWIAGTNYVKMTCKTLVMCLSSSHSLHVV